MKRLLSEVIASSDVPVLASGGIVDGRDVADALSSGADGVVIGTAFLASPKCLRTTITRNGCTARSQETLLTDMFHINWPIGAPVRVLQNSATQGLRGDPFGPKSVIGEGAFFQHDLLLPHDGTSRRWRSTRLGLIGRRDHPRGPALCPHTSHWMARALRRFPSIKKIRGLVLVLSPRDDNDPKSFTSSLLSF